MFYDEKGVAHDTLQARDNADRGYAADRRHEDDLERSNLTRYDVFIAGALFFATIVFFIPFLDMIQTGQGIWFTIKYFVLLAVSWSAWIYSLRFTTTQRIIFYTLLVLGSVGIGIYIKETS